jgi:D-sedoheptulose 7-phosphate isomerase
MILKKEIQEIINSSSKNILQVEKNSSQIESTVLKIISTIKNGNKIILFGNGGSAADAQHIAAEFIGRFQLERKSFPAIALSTDSSVITSLSNDYSFDLIFSRQCESLVDKNDLAIGISTSGNSKNVVNGLQTAKQIGAYTIGLLGHTDGQINKIVDIAINVDSKSTARIQEAHRIIYHIICELVEKNLVDNF